MVRPKLRQGEAMPHIGRRSRNVSCSFALTKTTNPESRATLGWEIQTTNQGEILASTTEELPPGHLLAG
jgi:hypothetical protein